ETYATLILDAKSAGIVKLKPLVEFCLVTNCPGGVMTICPSWLQNFLHRCIAHTYRQRVACEQRTLDRVDSSKARSARTHRRHCSWLPPALISKWVPRTNLWATAPTAAGSVSWRCDPSSFSSRDNVAGSMAVMISPMK